MHMNGSEGFSDALLDFLLSSYFTIINNDFVGLGRGACGMLFFMLYLR